MTFIWGQGPWDGLLSVTNCHTRTTIRLDFTAGLYVCECMCIGGDTQYAFVPNMIWFSWCTGQWNRIYQHEIKAYQWWSCTRIYYTENRHHVNGVGKKRCHCTYCTYNEMLHHWSLRGGADILGSVMWRWNLFWLEQSVYCQQIHIKKLRVKTNVAVYWCFCLDLSIKQTSYYFVVCLH